MSSRCSLASNPEQVALAEAIAAMALRHAPVSATRAESDALVSGSLPSGWPAFLDLGLTSLTLPAGYDGAGGSLLDLCVAAQEAGTALLPGPLTATMLAVHLRHSGGGHVTDVSAAAAVALGTGGLSAVPVDGGWQVEGSVAPVLGGAAAATLILGADCGDGEIWFSVAAPDVVVKPLAGQDLTRDIASVSITGLFVPAAHQLLLTATEVRRVAAAVFGAEAVGIARWCLDTVVEYAQVRQQFGRPIGSFQALQQRIAKLFVEVEIAAAAAWDAAESTDDDDAQRQLAASTAIVTCLPAATEAALESVCLLGGIGFTWEHDLHLYARRAEVLAALFGPVVSEAAALGQLSLATTRQRPAPVIDLDPSLVAEIRAELADIAGDPNPTARLADAGYLFPHYAAPFGRSAGAAEQLFIAAELRRVGLETPPTSVTDWVLPTLLAHGTPEQRERFVPGSVRGELIWCQLFSEPGAGSDLASLTTKAELTTEGWHLTGQKVWTSSAHLADFGVCLARSEPDLPRGRGLSYFIVDMTLPGVDIRPLRQASGEAHFNEVFLDVVLPHDALVGERAEGWRLARTTLSNERVSIADGVGRSRLDLVIRAANAGLFGTPAGEAIGRMTARQDALSALATRSATRRLSGLEPGPGGSVAKLAGGLHNRSVITQAIAMLGTAALAPVGDAATLVDYHRNLPSLLIGGGTEEIQLGVIAQHVLGLPRPA